VLFDAIQLRTDLLYARSRQHPLCSGDLSEYIVPVTAEHILVPYLIPGDTPGQFQVRLICLYCRCMCLPSLLVCDLTQLLRQKTCSGSCCSWFKHLQCTLWVVCNQPTSPRSSATCVALTGRNCDCAAVQLSLAKQGAYQGLLCVLTCVPSPQEWSRSLQPRAAVSCMQVPLSPACKCRVVCRSVLKTHQKGVGGTPSCPFFGDTLGLIRAMSASLPTMSLPQTPSTTPRSGCRTCASCEVCSSHVCRVLYAASITHVPFQPTQTMAACTASSVAASHEVSVTRLPTLFYARLHAPQPQAPHLLSQESIFQQACSLAGIAQDTNPRVTTACSTPAITWNDVPDTPLTNISETAPILARLKSWKPRTCRKSVHAQILQDLASMDARVGSVRPELLTSFKRRAARQSGAWCRSPVLETVLLPLDAVIKVCPR
jgi:hypothetical protein